jgi:hypothetical protein
MTNEMLDGKKVGQKLGEFTLAAKSGVVKGGNLLKSVFKITKAYASDVVTSYKQTVCNPVAMPKAKEIATRILNLETFEDVCPDGTHINVIKGVVQCDD